MGAGERANPFARINRPSGILDARGRKLEIGDEVILHTTQQQYMRVIDIRPVLHPNAPPGLLTITLSAIVNFHSGQGVPQTEFIRVRTAEEAGPVGVKMDANVETVPDAGDTPKED